MTPEEQLLENIRKKREEEEKKTQIFTTEEDDQGNVTSTFHYDRLTPEQKVLLDISYKPDEPSDYSKASELANKEFQNYQGYSRVDLTNLYKDYSEQSIEALNQNNIVDYYKSELLKTKIRNALNETTPATFAYDLGSNVGQGIANFGSGLADKAEQAKIGLETALDPKYNTSYRPVYNQTLGQMVDPSKGAEKKIEEVNTQKFRDYQTNSEVGKATSAINASNENIALRQELGDYNDLEKLLLTTGQVIPNTLMSAVVGRGIGGLTGSSALGYQAGLASMGLSAAGNTTTQRLNQGYDWNKSIEAGIADGLIEYTTEVVGGETLGRILWGTTKTVTPLGKLANKIFKTSKIKNRWLRLGVSILSDAGAEAVEEMVGEAVEPLLNQAILGEEITDWEQYGSDIFKAGLQSILPTLILGGMNRVQVATSIKSQMEGMTLAIETNPYISEEQKEKLRNGITQAYSDAVHLLTDAQSEEQYNQIVEDVYNALQEAQGKYESAKGLAEIINASTNLSRAQQTQQVANNILQRLEQTRQAQDTVGRLNNAEQEIQNITKGQETRNYINQTLNTPQSTMGQQNSSNQTTIEDIEVGKIYEVEYEGKKGTIEVRAINPETNQVLVRTSLEGTLLDGSAKTTATMTIDDLKTRLKELAPKSTQQSKELQQGTNPNSQTTQFDKLKMRIKGKIETDNGIERINVNNTQEAYDYIVDTEYNRDRNKEVTPDELYNSPVAFTVYGDNGSTTTIIYKNMNDWQKDMRVTYGGLNQVVGRGKNKMTYIIQSISGLGEYYAKRNSLYKGGWEWFDANGEKVYGGDFRKHRRRMAGTPTEPTKQAKPTSKKISRGLSSKKNDDNIEQLKDTVERKKEVSNYEYKTITDQDRAIVESDYRENKGKEKYLDQDGFVEFAYHDKQGREGYIVYGYSITEDGIKVISKYRGSRAYIDNVKKGIVKYGKNKFNRRPRRNTTNVSRTRSGRKQNSLGDVFDRRAKQSDKSSGQTDRIGRKESANNSTKVDGNISKSLNKQQDTDYQRDLFEVILEQLDEAEINKEAIKLWEEETGKTWQMDGWDYLQDDDDIMEKAREIVYERFVNSEEGQKFIEEFEENYSPKDLTFSTDMEKNRHSIVERKLKEIEANPKLREEHETTSLTEIRNFTNQQLLKGRLGTGQFRHQAYGVYNRLSNWIRLRQGSNVDTLMHETGHFIDDEIVPNMYKNNPEMKKELGKLCEMAFPGSYRGKTKLMEGFAEATRYFIIAPKDLAKIAPVTTAVITNEFDNSPVLKDVYPKLQKMFHDYINMTPQERVHSKVVTGTPKDNPSIGGKGQNALRWIVREAFNKNEAATFYDKIMEKAWNKKYGKGTPLPTVLRLFDNLRRANSSGDSIKQLLTNGVYDPMDGKRVTKGVNRILEPFKEEAETKAKELGLTKDEYLNRRINDMIDLGLAERTIELLERSAREGKIYETGIRVEDAEAIIKQFKGDKAIHQVLKDIRQVGNDIIDYAVKKGVLKEEAASTIKASNAFYMPLNRIMDEFGSFGASTSNGATGNPFHRSKGSDRDIQNPMESLVGNWARVLKTIDDNFVRQQMVKVGKQVGDYGDFFTEVAPLSKYQGTVTLEVFKKFLEENLSPWEFNNLNLEETYNLFVPELASPEKMTLSYLENGKRKYIKFANNDYGRPLYEMLTMLNANQVNQVLNAISWFNQGIRLGATSMNPFFALGNTISDEFQAFLYSDGLVIPVAQAIFDIARLWKAKRVLNREDISTSDRELKELYSRYKTSNASLAGKFKLAEKNVKEVTPDIWGVSNKALFGSESKLNKAKDIKNKFGKMLSAIPEFSEEMTRFGEFVRVYKQLVREGMSKPQAQLEAGIKAREITQDFSIQGEFMQHLNKIIPFSAAKVGGLYRFGQEFKKHPGRLSMRMGMLIGFAMLVAQLRHGDDDAEEYYEELNNRKKFDNFVFDNPTDGAHPFVIKKPQGVPRYFLGLTEYIFDLATGYIPKGEEEKRFKDWLALSTSDLLPINSPTDMVPGFVQPLLENILNQDFYYGSKIVPTNLEKLDPENQYNEYTSEIGKALGKILNISPIKIDNFIEGSFAGMGSFVLDTVDFGIDFATGNDTRVRGQDYVKSRLFGDVFRSSESVNMVYEKLEKYENDEAEGRLTEEEAEEYERLKVAKTIFNKISKQMKEIRTDDTMKTEQKEKELNKLYELRTDTARYYLGKDLINEANKDKVETYRYYPASTTYKYKVGNKTVELSFEDNKIQEEYAKLLKDTYEKELSKLQRKSEYRKATTSEQAELEKNLLSNTRQKVNEEMKKKVYREQRK